MIRVTAEAAQKLQQAFLPLRKKGVSIGALAATDGGSIAEILQLPGSVKVKSLKPFIAQNSVVFPDVRHRMNPLLFSTTHAAPRPTDSERELRVAEDRVSRWFEVQYEGDVAPQDILGAFYKSSFIEIAEPRYIRRTQFVPNDSLIEAQFHLEAMNVFKAWDFVRCDTNMIIANVDVGVDWTHPDLITSVQINHAETGLDADGIDKRANAVDDDNNGFVDDWHGWDFAGPFGESQDNDTRTEDIHGTHTAGISSATTNNREGIAGIAFGARLLPIKAADNFGQYISFGYEGIAYAANAGVRIVNCSWGGRQRSSAEDDVVQYAYAKNTIVVAASGNDGDFIDFYPASYDNVLSVAWMNVDGTRDWSSNYGVRVDVGAPGSSILSTIPGTGYGYSGGTSMATPQVSGALALLLTKYPELTAGQAIEMVRASAQGNKDSSVLDYMGRGMIDIFRSVTDTNLFSARLNGVEIFDQSEDGVLSAGENGAVELSIKNYLKPLSSITATIEFVENGEYIETNTETINFGPSNTLSIVKNLQADFRFRVADSTPPNTTVLVKVIISDPEKGYGPDIDFFRIVLHPSYRDLNRNNLTVTFDSKGGIGFNDPVTHTQGNGFLWKNAPGSIVTQGRSVLYQSGLMLTDGPERIVGLVPAEWSNAVTDDFETLQPISQVAPVTRPDVVQELRTVYDDSKAEDSIEVGVTVDQRSFAYNVGESRDAVVVSYKLRKRETATGALPSDNTHLMLYMDWDIGPSGAMNHTRFDEKRGVAFMKRLDPNFPVVVAKIISELPEGSRVHFHGIQNNGDEGIVETYNGLTMNEKWLAASLKRDSAGPADVSQMFGVKDLPMLTLDSIEVTYAIAMGVDEGRALRALNKVEEAYEGRLTVSTPDAHEGLRVWPNPFSDRITVSVTEAVRGSATVYDALGRVVYSRILGSTTSEIALGSLSAGVYRLVITGGDGHEISQQIVKVR